MRRLIATIGAAALLVGLCGCGAPARGVTLYAADGTVMGTVRAVGDRDGLADPAYGSYADIVIAEAVAALSQEGDLAPETVLDTFFREGYSIHTALDPAVLAALKAGYEQQGATDLAFGTAITDHSGRLLATYSVGEQNYAAAAQSPHSAFKPLSVYAPAMDAGLIDWSTTVTDKPYKKVQDESGKSRDWPTNPSGGYTYKKTTLYECIRQSLNTAAVYTLSRLGVEQSLEFLQRSLGLTLTYEMDKCAAEGGEEVIGNIALGSLQTGVSPVQMAGYYQIFGNGGQYTAAHSVLEIRDSGDNAVYTARPTAVQAIKPATATIMNRLLQGVVKGSGTGADLGPTAVPVAGKTGTGDTGEGNWFVGVTPQYSCAVFHGDCDDGNIADQLFGKILQNLPEHTVTDFPTCDTVHKAVYCTKSGLLYGSGCTGMYVGYYDEQHPPAVCTAH